MANFAKDIVSPEQARAVILAGLSERDFLATVVAMAQAHGWLVHHVLEQKHFAKRIGPGFPDLVIARPPQVYIIELKSERGRLTPDQKIWLGVLEKCTRITCGCIRPSDLERLAQLLQG